MHKQLKVIDGGKILSEAEPDAWKVLLDDAKKALAQSREFRASPACFHPMKGEKGQPRKYFDEDSILRLADAIRSVGQVYPGIVRKSGKGQYELIDGERRWRAVTLVGIEYRALEVDISNEAVPFLVACISNFNRESHTPLEISDAVARMYDDMRMPIEEVAKVLGMSVIWSRQMMSLRHLPSEVRELMDPTLSKDVRLATTAAVQIARMPPKLMLAMAKRVVAGEVSLSSLRKEVVQTTRKEGGYIQTRTMEPSRRWAVVGSRMNYLRRVLSDLEESLDAPDIHRMVRSKMRGFDLAKALENLDAFQGIITRCRKKLNAAKDRV